MHLSHFTVVWTQISVHPFVRRSNPLDCFRKKSDVIFVFAVDCCALVLVLLDLINDRTRLHSVLEILMNFDKIVSSLPLELHRNRRAFVTY